MTGKEKCKENTGFLTLRRCERDAVAQCGFCKKPVCEEHSPRGASGAIACVTCIREKKDQVPPRPQDQDSSQYSYWDNYYFYGPHYHSYYFDDYHPYSVHDRFDEKDYSVFNAEAPDRGTMEEGFEGS